MLELQDVAVEQAELLGVEDDLVDAVFALALPRTTTNPVPAVAQLSRDRVPPAPKVIEADT